MGRKAAAGTGTIRKKTVTRSGKQYTYWEARFTAGYDPGTGKQVQRSITGKTQKEVAQKLKAADGGGVAGYLGGGLPGRRKADNGKGV